MVISAFCSENNQRSIVIYTSVTYKCFGDLCFTFCFTTVPPLHTNRSAADSGCDHHHWSGRRYQDRTRQGQWKQCPHVFLLQLRPPLSFFVPPSHLHSYLSLPYHHLRPPYYYHSLPLSLPFPLPFPFSLCLHYTGVCGAQQRDSL